MKSTITHHSLGEITVSQTWRAKRISISVRPPGIVRLSLPYNVPLSEAVKFLDTKAEWVRKALDKYSAVERQAVVTPPYSTRLHSLELIERNADTINVRVVGGVIKVSYPSGMDSTAPNLQQHIKKGIEAAWRIEASGLLPERLRSLASVFGFRHGKVTVRNTVSKWGSCSAVNDISLSLHLMRLPDHLIDYVLLHELCHTVHKNHGPQFHKLLDKCVGGRSDALRKELKGYHTRW